MTPPFTRPGRRGAFLLILSGAQAILGWTTLTLPIATIHSLKAFQHLSPLELGLTWLIPAAVSFAAAWMPPGRDGKAFVLGYLAFFFWGAAYVASLALGDLSAVVALRPAGFYWCIAGLILVASGCPEGKDTPR